MPDKIILSCPVRNCQFCIKIHGKTQWSKVSKAFIQHLIEQHSVKDIVETLYLLVSAKVDETYESLAKSTKLAG